MNKRGMDRRRLFQTIKESKRDEGRRRKKRGRNPKTRKKKGRIKQCYDKRTKFHH